MSNFFKAGDKVRFSVGNKTYAEQNGFEPNKVYTVKQNCAANNFFDLLYPKEKDEGSYAYRFEKVTEVQVEQPVTQKPYLWALIDKTTSKVYRAYDSRELARLSKLNSETIKKIYFTVE